MTHALAELGLLIAAWVSFAAASSLAVTLAWRLGARRLRARHPRIRAAAAWTAAAAPSLAPTLLVALCLAPGIVGLALGSGDHCREHADHPHLCVVHLTAALRAPLVAIVAAGGAALGFALLRAGTRAARGRRALAALGARARPSPEPDVRVVASERPFCVAAGLVRGEVWIASSLADALPSDALAAVLAHERAHVARRDPLLGATAAALSWPLSPRVRHAVLAELELASEQACDEAAAERVGDRLHVAEAILAVERAVAGGAALAAPAGVRAFGASNVRARVESLLDAPRRAGPTARVAWAALAVLTAAAPLAADALHHWTEHWIGLLLG